ncbi:MAG: aminomethyl-transferring glycine dehydrogenase subunit GcvPB [candidate division WOR-3 bacterium]|nr:aminomethyl-transferring glycine dehydrogenase subunit GcvPB [candidate division WOR-3 bacterium]
MLEKLIKEYSKKGKFNDYFGDLDIPEKKIESNIPENLLRKDFEFIEVSEIEVIRHFIRLSALNYHLDKGIYPLGSCTMKHNPKVNEEVSSYEGFLYLHPLQKEEDIQGALKLMYELSQFLKEISGMDYVSLQPPAGASGELTAMLVIKKYFIDKKEDRKIVLIPDSAHGTNPASVAMAGFIAQTIKSNSEGMIDLEDLKKNLNEKVACLMITNPNTLGIFERNIKGIAEELHKYGALLYLDGANLNAYCGIHKPGDAGVDIMHFNLHKTFSTPHGGGGPGAGPVGAKNFLVPYLPNPKIEKNGERYYFKYDKESIGKTASFYGNFNVFVKAYTYIRMHGIKGLKKMSQIAVLNASYLRKRLEELGFYCEYKTPTLHEFVLTLKDFKKVDVRALDIAKRLLDYHCHAPTVYFPLIVPEAFMIEPTETEPKEELERFVSAMKRIKEEIKENPEIVKNAPHNTPVRRLDEGKAGRELVVKWG